MNKIYFDPREWFELKDNPESVISRTFITGFEGKLVEAYTLGDWRFHWSEIISKSMELEAGKEYVFTFWLNGGENDQSNEVCDFRVLFSDNETELFNRDTEYIFKLNRGYIKPVKKFAGWELYEIPFTAVNKKFTRLKFVQMSAPLMIMPAKDLEFYKDYVDTVDEFEGIRPQRHNNVFSDGWPIDTWYSTKRLKSGGNSTNNNNFNRNSNNDFGFIGNKFNGNAFNNGFVDNGDYEELDDQINDLDDRINSFEDRINSFEDRFSSLEDRINDMQTQIMEAIKP